MHRSTTKNRTRKSGFIPAALFNRKAALALATGAFLLAANSAIADELIWTTNASADFNTAADWSDYTVIPITHRVPGSADNADVAGGGTVLIQAGDTVATNDMNAGGTFGTGNANGSVTGNGTYMQTGGAVTVGNNGGWFRFGTAANTTGQYLMSGGTFAMKSNGELNIGENNGTNVANSCVLTVSNGAVFSNTNSTGALQLAIGGQSNGGAGVGTGILNISDAGNLGTVLNNNGELWIGENAGSTGVMNMSGGTLNNANWIAVGRNTATGTLNLSGGTINKTSGGNITIIGGTTAALTANVNQTGGTINNTTSGTWIGEGVANSLAAYNMSGGLANLAGLVINENGVSKGTVTLSGTGILSTTQVSQVAGAGTAVFNFNGGTLQANIGANATFMAGLTTANILAGGATIDSNGQTINITQALLHGTGATADGGLIKKGSGTLVLNAANTFTGATNINAGTLALAGTGNPSNRLGNTINVNSGGTLQLNASNEIATSGVVNLYGGASAATFALQGNLDYFGGLNLNGNSAVTGTGGFTLEVANPAINVTGIGNTISSGVYITSGFGAVGGNKTLTLNTTGVADALGISGVIANGTTDGGAGALVGSVAKTGGGNADAVGGQHLHRNHHSQRRNPERHRLTGKRRRRHREQRRGSIGSRQRHHHRQDRRRGHGCRGRRD